MSSIFPKYSRRRGLRRQASRLRNRLIANPSVRMILNSLKAFKKLVFESSLLYLPFMLLFLFNTTDFLVLLEFENAPIRNIFHRDDFWYIEDENLRLKAELVKQQLKYYVLALIAILVAGNIKYIINFFNSNRDQILLLAVLAMGYFYSVEPSKVVSNVANLLFSLFTCILFVLHKRNFNDIVVNTIAVIFFSASLVLTGGALLLTQIGVDPIAMYIEGNRFGGLAGNANSQGMLAIIAVWSGLALLSQKTQYRWAIPIIISVLLIDTAMLVFSGSATSWIISGLAALLIFWGRFIQRTSVSTSVNVTLFLFAIILISGCIFVAVVAQDSILATLTGMLGKDATLTGRTELWSIAMDAIKDRPLIGYSYDSHITVFSNPEYYLPLKQFHNGYLDTMVAGGVFLIAILVYHLYCFVRNGIVAIGVDKDVYILLMPLLFLLIHNMSEYSILRTNSILWFVFTLCYAVVSIRRLKKSRRKRRSGKGSRHYRFE